MCNDDDEYDEQDDEREETPVPVSFPGGGKVCFLGAYSRTREYGGPEEGGWWYDAGNLLEVVVCREEERDAAEATLRTKYPPAQRPWSMRPDPDHVVRCTDKWPVAHFPKVTPHYE